MTADHSQLPTQFTSWFDRQGWAPRPHQIKLLEQANCGASTLLIAPTGAGKTLAGFLPSLTDLSKRAPIKPSMVKPGLHTIYISPLKALAVDIERNLTKPIEGMGLDIKVETRTGDTPQHKRQRQKVNPPDILLTTPEQLSLLLANQQAEHYFKGVKYIIFDELHSLVTSKRGHLLALALSRLRAHAPKLQTIGLSATVAFPEDLQKWLVPQRPNETHRSEIIVVDGGAKPNISILRSKERIPWSGHIARYAIPDIYEEIKLHGTTLLFVNTRSQAEILFQELWTINDDSLPIALHHGSLDLNQRRKVEAAMARSELRAVVATSTLDLGIDWGDVDLVVHIGAPKGASRLAQRIGRSNHRMDEPSKAILVPANRFEVMECQAALNANYIGAQDTPPLLDGAIDVLAQHVLGMACAKPFFEAELFAEIISAAPYANLTDKDFLRIIEFVATGGYALKSYERYARIRKTQDGTWRISNPQIAQQYRLNIGTIIEAPELNVRMVSKKKSGSFGSGTGGSGTVGRGPVGRGGPSLGKIEEYFLEMLAPGDTFLFSGKILRFEGIRENECLASKTFDESPKVPAYAGGKFPLSTYLADQVRKMLMDPQAWAKLPEQVREWLELQKKYSILPSHNELLLETFPRQKKHYMVIYPFEGRLAHQTLGMLLTRRLERMHAKPLGFVANDYALAIWALDDIGAQIKNGLISISELFHQDMLGDDLEAWLDESWMLKRTFRNCAIISGLIERRHPGQEKSGRQVTVSADLIYDVLRSHEPDHILLQATRSDAATGLLDVKRLSDMLSRIKGGIVHKNLDQISPLAVPIMLEIGRETVSGEAQESILSEAADDILAEAVSGAEIMTGMS